MPFIQNPLQKMSVPELLTETRALFSNLPDARKTATSNNLKYAVEDAALSAFSVFFTQSPSFLDYQTRMAANSGKSNAQSIFGVHKIPSMNQLRMILDPISPETLSPLFRKISSMLYQQEHLKPYRAIENTLLLALDGTDTFSSEKISCPCCTQQTLKNGHILNRHIAVTPVIVAPGQSRIIPLFPEFVHPQDGETKQDCELAASKRWLKKEGDHYSPWNVTLLGDDLYCHQPFCEMSRTKGYHFLFACKPDSHTLLYEWIADFERNGTLCTLEKTHWNGKQHITSRYRYMNQIPLRNSDDALMVNWCEVTITNQTGKTLYHNTWATSHEITDDNIATLVESGRARWKIENENNNVLKNHGYHFEHNFGHGKQNLSNLIATLIILAYLFHTVLEWTDSQYQQIRMLLPSRKTFFEHLRALTQYFLFDSWQHLMQFMLDKLHGNSPPNNMVLN